MPPNKYDFIEKEVNLRKVIAEKTKSQEPFCLARIPGEEIELFTGVSYSHQIGKRQVICKPWHSDTEPIYFFEGKGDTIKRNEVANSEEQTSYASYQRSFEECMRHLKSQKLEKVVLSRIEFVEAQITPDLFTLFQKAVSHYPETFVYIILHPSEGIWLGASPEILLKKTGEVYESVSLAGTQPISSEPYIWEEKERVEQLLVSDQIRSVLTHLNCNIVSEIGPETAEAGKVAHLKTRFLFSSEESLQSLLKNLHPTPAVAGLPKKDSIELIDKTELHNRGLYTGYIGLYDSEKADIYVNLRCMRVVSNGYYLYLGGGLTEDSELMKEWKETELKASTLLNLIDE